MLSLQIILTYKSRLKYGNQKNSWKVSINHKTLVVVFVKSASESWARKEMKWVFQSRSGWLLGCRLAEERGWLRIPAQRLRAPKSRWALGESPLSPRTAVVIRTKSAIHQPRGFFRHPVCWSEGRLWGIRLALSGLCLWSEQATEPSTFHLAEAYMLEKSWQFIHFAPSWSQLMSDWRDPPSLMLSSSESALLWKKFYPSKLKGNISASSC